jgi:hypothetical protein
MNMNPISNINDYLDALKSRRDEFQSNDYEVFFRGHSDATYKVVPKVYRKSTVNKKCYANPKNEHKLFANAETKYPEAFIAQDTTFEKIALMQHYGVSTRLLDLTENALIALYFACSNYKDKKDGAVLVFGIKQEVIKYYNGDSVSILCAISKLPNEKIMPIADEFYKLFMAESFDTKRHKNLNAIQQRAKSLKSSTIIESIRNSYKTLTAIEIEKTTEFLNKCDHIGYIMHEIGHEKPHFKPIIRVEDFDNRILCVKSKLNNDRIKAQSGLFLLFGIYGADKSKLPRIDFAKHKENIEFKEINIDKANKSKILNDLKVLGISDSTVFPGLAHSSDKNILGL